LAPNFTDDAPLTPVKLVPVMVTLVPPAAVPVLEPVDEGQSTEHVQRHRYRPLQCRKCLGHRSKYDNGGPK